MVLREVPGTFSALSRIPRGYVITRQISELEVMTFSGRMETAILKIPAPLACYWLSRSEGRS